MEADSLDVFYGAYLLEQLARVEALKKSANAMFSGGDAGGSCREYQRGLELLEPKGLIFLAV